LSWKAGDADELSKVIQKCAIRVREQVLFARVIDNVALENDYIRDREQEKPPGVSGVQRDSFARRLPVRGFISGDDRAGYCLRVSFGKYDIGQTKKIQGARLLYHFSLIST
jgi:hypothetical protein